MLTTLAVLGALGASPARPAKSSTTATEVTSTGPGLGVRIAAAALEGTHGGVTLRMAPVEVGWEIRAGAPEKPSRFGAALAGVAHGDWLEARALEISELVSPRLGTKSLYVNPFALDLRRRISVVPGTLELSARLELTFSLWQSTADLDATSAVPLPCSSGSLAQALVEATIRHDLSVGLLAGVSDDPVHFDDGSECIGGGDVWRSSSWLGARASARLDRTWTLIVEAGHSFEELHSVLEDPAAHTGAAHAHEHVALRRVDGFEGGAWLGASF